MFDEPLPLVVEIWSPSTGGYDVDEKLPEYLRRGDREIWRVHPVELTLTAWRRQTDGSYAESIQRAGLLELAALPGITIDIDALFALARWTPADRHRNSRIDGRGAQPGEQRSD